MTDKLKLENLKKSRTGIRTQTTKLFNKIKCALEDKSLEDEERFDTLNILKEQLNEKHDTLKSLNSEIQTLSSEGDFEAEIESCENYSENIIEWRYKLTKSVNQLSKNQNVTSESTALKNETQIVARSGNNIKLPKIFIGKFYGDSSAWLEFWGQFSNTIDNNPNLTPIEKFSYLKSLLGGSASNAVAGFSLTEGNYVSALELLKNRFGRNDLVINSHMSKLLNLRAVKSAYNVKELRELYDTIEIQIRSLQSLGVTAGSYGHLLCPILLKLIPSEISLEFNRMKIKNKDLDVNELISLLKDELQSREATAQNNNIENCFNTTKEKYKHNFKFKRSNTPSASALTANVRNECIFCNLNHDSTKCTEFSIPEKREKLRNEGRCYLCFKKYHISSKCKLRTEPCKICHGKFHNTSLCLNSLKSSTKELDSEATKNSETVIASVSNCRSKISNDYSTKETILQTCSVNVESDSGSGIFVCLYDTGSQKSFVTQKLVSKLNPPIIRQEKLQIYAFGAIKAQEKIFNVVELKLSHVKDKSRSLVIQALVTDVISNALIYCPPLSEQLKSKVASFELSNCSDSRGGEINILIGADHYYAISYNRKLKRISKSLFLCESLFGFSLCGSFDGSQQSNERTSVLNVSAINVEQNDLKFLWELEGLGIRSEDEISDLDKEIMTNFENGLEFVDNRYEAGLLWKDEKFKVGNNFRIARKRFEELTRKLEKDRDLFKNYKNIVSEQELDGVVEECSDKLIENGYFMPHRPVIREDKSTTKVRMVFDASSKESHLNSLNDCLSPGPNLNPNILDVIFNFRYHNVAFCADLEKAFLQIGIKEQDRNYLKFLWFSDEDNFKFLRFKRAPFGVTCSPFILAATIKHHVRKYQDHPEVVKMLDSHLYVDDWISGSKSDDEAYYLTSTASDIFSEAGMKLRKFNTNSAKLRKLWEENQVCDIQENSSNSLKILGLVWDTDSDTLRLDVQNCSGDRELGNTKRGVLKYILKIFDPIGIVAPFAIRMRCLLQETWQRGLGWDTALPEDLKADWESWCSEIDHLNKFEVPRKYFSESVNILDPVQIHIFSDASPKAFGAVAYLRCRTSNDKFETSFVWAKCRVAPIKRLTIPRLELMGAVIAARMSKFLKNAFNGQNIDIRIWSDSTITLHWIKGSPLNWKPFVANRVAEIQNLTSPEIWSYCPGNENPSDYLTRGEKLVKLNQNKLWLNGPEWLSMPENMWPLSEEITVDKEVFDERKSNLKSNQLSCVVNVLPEAEPLLKLENYSKINRVYNVTAWIMRFINNANKSKTKLTGPLTTPEIEKAEYYWLKFTQESAFKQEIELLKHEKEICKTSPLYHLNPKLSEDHLLNLSGRLQFSEFTVREKHPWVLPYGSYFAKLLILEAHEKMLHGGVAITLAHLREKYFIIKGRKFVKSILKTCMICKRFKASPGQEEIAPLPKDRIIESPPFSTCAVDFAGPIYVKEKSGSDKAYIVLFTCAVTRAVHLELASNMSTENFILAFKRFISRRGLCKIIYSDNAKTFIKADNFLRGIWSRISQAEIQHYFSLHNIIWKFIVPRASWWGGFWERMVRSVKAPLKKILGRSCLTYEEIETVLTEIEAVVNGRPLTYLYDDNDEPLPLTPADFLIGRRINSIPDVPKSFEPKSNKSILTKQLRYRQQITDHFWKRWRKEYLLELRSANFTNPISSQCTFKIGDIVLIHEDRVPKHLWKYGIIKELFYGRDSKVRACALQTSTGLIRRPIQLLYNLELDIN